MRLFLLFFLWLSCLAPAPADEGPWDVAPQFAWRKNIWQRDARPFLQLASEKGFRPTSARDSLRSGNPVVFRGIEARHSHIFLLSRKQPIRWEWIIHDQDLYGEISSARLTGLLAQTTNSLQRWSGREPLAMETRPGMKHLTWGRPPHIVSAVWNDLAATDTPSANQFLQVVFEPWPPRRDWTANLVKRVNGDRWLTGVTMVDQVFQGNCAPATVERLMRYYGIPLSARSLAELAESSSDSGTNVGRMLEKISRMRSMPCRIEALFDFNIRRFDLTIQRYNREAAQQGLELLVWQPPVLDLAQVFAGADAGLLRSVRQRDSGKRRFWRSVVDAVEAGHPLVWGVVLGIVAEEKLPTGMSGGHLRLIIGYNPAKREILYTDSWGAGHELKRLSLDDAWTATISLHTIVPVP